MAMTQSLVLPPEHMAELAEVFRLMGDPSRLGILMSIMDEALSVGEIAAQTDHSVSLVSHHLRLLRARRLVRGERRGKQIFYTLDDAHVRSVLHDMAAHMREDAR